METGFLIGLPMPLRGKLGEYMGTEVEVYRNLHKNAWSVRSVRTGRVIHHADSVVLGDCKFVVRQAGNRKVRETGRKNVHAFIRGRLLGVDLEYMPAYYFKVRYNPYENTTFMQGQRAIFEAERVALYADRTVRVDTIRRK